MRELNPPSRLGESSQIPPSLISGRQQGKVTRSVFAQAFIIASGANLSDPFHRNSIGYLHYQIAKEFGNISRGEGSSFSTRYQFLIKLETSKRLFVDASIQDSSPLSLHVPGLVGFLR